MWNMPIIEKIYKYSGKNKTQLQILKLYLPIELTEMANLVSSFHILSQVRNEMNQNNRK